MQKDQSKTLEMVISGIYQRETIKRAFLRGDCDATTPP